ncbi:MAG: AAA family ATPase, partial [Bacteroidales bacterium]|nr:AAA family ATPase [Bacteroidales bacterium]
LYQIISGRLPFAGTDAIELVHSHIAKNPEPLYKITDNIPGILSDIIMKLLAKNPDERYQSAQGLKQDLELCLDQLQKKGKIDDFELGTNDHSGRFQITHKIYGRKSEIDRLIESFHRTRNGNNELVMISGYSGIGKSLLVTEIHKPVIQNNGIFIKGQYDRFKKDVPLHGLAQAFNELIIGLLSGTEKALSKWKDSFIKTFGPNGKIITDIIPDMEQIIGEQPNTQSLNPLEATNRIIMMFRNFIRVIAQKEHPLVIFLDDVQWSDQLSLHLIKDIAINEIPYVMLICAFRSNEEYKEHMVNLTFSEIEKARNFEKLHVDNLPLDAVKQLIADSLHCSIDDTTELSESIYSKTHGNPFFTKQLLKTLYRENYLKFNYRKNSWQWDINEIRNAQIADNLIDVVKDRIQKLPNECIDALKIASCVGGKFDLQTIASLLNKPALEVSSLLISALD